jgi:hypothetical protein
MENSILYHPNSHKIRPATIETKFAAAATALAGKKTPSFHK